MTPRSTRTLQKPRKVPRNWYFPSFGATPSGAACAAMRGRGKRSARRARRDDGEPWLETVEQAQKLRRLRRVAGDGDAACRDCVGEGELPQHDGVDIVFELTPGTEAPAEMNLYFPQFRVLDMAENATHTMHNLYTLRGAEIRDGNAWARYLDDALVRFGGKSDVLIAQHHWPVWGEAELQAYLAKQRDLYKFINDQSLRLLNQGYTPGEIADELALPRSLAQEWALRGYYGTLRHNARAVYQKYLGW